MARFSQNSSSNNASSALNYVQVAGAQQIVSSAPNSIIDLNITTTGKPVQISVTGEAANENAGSWVRINLFRDGVAIGNEMQLEASAESENVPYAINFIDNVAAGTYNYSARVTTIAGGSWTFGEAAGPVMNAVELTGFEGDRGPRGFTGDSAYEVALANGFVGTEQEWLDSLGGAADLIIPTAIKDENNDDFITFTRTSTGTARIDAPQDDLSLRSAADITLFAGTDGPGNVYIGWGDAEYTPDSPNRVATIGDIQDNHGNFVFNNSTLSVDNDTTYIKATDGGDDSTEFMMDPYNGVAKISARTGQQTPRYYASSPDWDSATWTTLGQYFGQVSFVNAPNIVSLVNNELNSAINVGVYINGTTAGVWNGASTDGNNITIYIAGPNAENTQNLGVDDFGFNYVYESKLEINNNEGEVNIVARQADVNIESDDDVYITATGDDIHIRANDDIRFLANYNNGGIQYDWRMDSEGKFQLPGDGYIENLVDSSGDGNGYDTIKIVPDAEREEFDQYLIIDPTFPNHIHIRAGGSQDYSNAELILGSERAHVKVADSSGNVEIQAKKEDYSWTYQNINGDGGTIYAVQSEVAEPDYGDFMLNGGIKYVITYVNRNQNAGVTEYSTTPSFNFIYNEYYTFTRDNGTHTWIFDSVDDNPTLILPEGNAVIANVAVPGSIVLSAYNGVELSFAETEGAGLKFPDQTVQTTAYVPGAGANGEVTRWSPNFQATGLTFTGSGATYPTYNSHYVKNGRMVSFWIEIDLSTVTNFGTGQYITALPFAPLTGTMNHFQAWANVDPAQNPDIAGHVVLQADHLANTTALDIHYLKQAGGAHTPVVEGMFKQGEPATLTTSSKIYINGTYITAE